MSYDPVAIVLKELHAHGVADKDIEVDRSTNHPKIRFTFDGKPLLHVVPGSPSDVRGWHRSLTDLRRTMGVGRIVIKSKSAKRRRRNPTERKETLADLSFSTRPDPLASLQAVADRLKAYIADAWRMGEAAFL